MVNQINNPKIAGNTEPDRFLSLKRSRFGDETQNLWEHNFCANSLLAFMPTNDSELQTQAQRILDAAVYEAYSISF